MHGRRCRWALALGLLALALGGSGCAGGRIVSVGLSPPGGELTKSRPIMVKSFDTAETAFTGDGQEDASVVETKNAALSGAIATTLVDILTAEGFRVETYGGAEGEGEGEGEGDGAGEAAVIDGRILQSDRGSWALRSFVGMGAGATRVLAEVRIYPEGKPEALLAELIVESTRGGGAYGDGIARDSEDIANAIRVYMTQQVGP